MSLHNIPTNITLDEWIAKVSAAIREPEGITYTDETITTPSQLLFEPDLTAGETTIYDDLAQGESFLDAMRPIVKAWHTNTLTGNGIAEQTTIALTAVQTILTNHPTQQAIIINRRWIQARNRFNILVSIGSILTNLGQIGNEFNENVVWNEVVMPYYFDLLVGRNL